jgi:hypothetical protein
VITRLWAVINGAQMRQPTRSRKPEVRDLFIVFGPWGRMPSAARSAYSIPAEERLQERGSANRIMTLGTGAALMLGLLLRRSLTSAS